MEAKEFIWGYISVRKREILGVHTSQTVPKMYVVSGRKHC